MTERLETVIADTPFEAYEIAKQKYGNNYKILNTETIKNKLYFGFGSKEQIKLTISISNDMPRTAPAVSYRIPTEQNNYKNDKVQESSSQYSPRPIAVSSSMASNAYKKTLQLDRDVDGLRSLQEGNDEPHSQKQTSESFKNSAEQILESISEIKRGRINANSMTRELRENKCTSKKLEEIQSQIEALTATIKKLTENSNDFLAGKHLPKALQNLEKELLNVETPQEIINQLLQDLQLCCSDNTLSQSKQASDALKNLIKERLVISNQFTLKKSNKPQVIVLMGPTGVGKTTTIAKLAAKFCFNPDMPIKASIFNIDFYKLGAKDQLQKYAEIFNIPLEDICSVASLDYYLKQHCNDDLIIVDTAGRSQYAYQDLQELKTYLDRIPNATKYLAVSSTSKYSDLKEIVKSFGTIGFDHIILTKTDETKTIGPAVGILLKSNKSVAYITHGQSVPEDYSVANFSFFEEKIFHRI